MANFIVTTSSTSKVTNKVYFAEDLDSAIDMRTTLSAKDKGKATWIIAEILDEKNWLVRLIFKLRGKINGN